ncbi:MAG TPA: hypothetical protein VGR02_19290 [Thermoanaerobaculia bacterium]|nr:hypothetical protein [Thermoanaerobaculia bacterium]
MEIVRESERVVLPLPRPRVGIESMAGHWCKTNDSAQWIDSLEIVVEGDGLVVHVYGGGAGPTPADWGSARTDIVYASNVLSGDAKAGAFIARFELPEAQVEMQANLNLGLLVVATYVSFREPGAWANRFTREFFRREDGA